jgi:hypothetical protein
MLVGFLNDGKFGPLHRDEAFREELVALVVEWMKAKRAWPRFLERRLRASKTVAFTRGTFYVPGQLPPGSSTPVMIPQGLEEGSTDAQGQFLRFVLNPDSWRLGRNPCKRCGRYFLRAKRTEEKIYCTHKCASGNLPAEGMRAARKAKHEELAKLAKIAIAQWEREPLKVILWEDWVADQVTRVGLDKGLLKKDEVVTGRMIRGWVKHKGLKPPVERRRKGA